MKNNYSIRKFNIGNEPAVEGTIDCKGDRFGFVDADGDDIFVSGRDLGGARHGDKVRVVVTGRRSSRDGSLKREGRVIKVVEKNPLNIIATVVYHDNRFYALPDDRHFGDELEISSLGGASKHDKVIIDILPGHTEGTDRAKVLAVLGRFDEIGMDVKCVIASHNLRTEFPRSVVKEAEALPTEVAQEDIKAAYRTDFRDCVTFTIDGSDSKDFDDAVSLVSTENGYRLGVYIADVAQYVTEGSALDDEAFKRGTSVYLADRVIPMLPEKLSNGLCSLNEGVDRLVLAVLIDLNDSGERIGYKICEGVIRSRARLTYTGVQAMLDGDESLREKYAEVVPTLELMKELAAKRIAIRHARGSIEFKLTETQIKFDGVGHVVDIEKKPALFSMRIIEEFMILANCAVADRYAKAKSPFVFRVHEPPAADRLEALNDYLEAVGINDRLTLEPTPKQVSKLLESIDGTVEGAVSRVTLRAMAKATYEPRNLGHFGLAEKYYCHFTSPIRRYPDLMIHRIIKATLHDGMAAAKRFCDVVDDAAKQSSKQERVAQECERKVDDYKKAEYLSHHIGEKYSGIISSVTEHGFYVELDNSAEGLVRMNMLPGYATFDPRRMMIAVGMKKFCLGDTIDIIVDKVVADKVDFRLA
ncbi:MAG: ribonuclease R [Clostridiales bacterium]|nr:ribonuclease R [Clostridiales bacterium]